MKKPGHPDFEAFAAAARTIDAKAGQGIPVTQIISEFADSASAEYAAVERAKFYRDNMPARVQTPSVAAALTLVWLDGMIAGYRLRQARQHRPAPGTQP